MKTELIVDELSEFDRNKLITLAADIGRSKQRSAESIIAIGAAIAEAQTILADHHSGRFQKWIEEDCGISIRSGYNYLAAYTTFGKQLCNVAQLEPAAMYLLAGASEAARKKSLKLAEKGEKITNARAKEIIREMEAAQEPEDEPSTPPVAPEAAKILAKAKVDAPEEVLAGLAEYDPTDQVLLAESVAAGRQSLDVAVETGEVPEPTIEEQIEEENARIESYCREVMKLAKDNLPATPWLDHQGKGDSALQKIRDGLSLVRTAKAVGPCPKCVGDGCRICKNTGRLPRAEMESVG